MLRQLLRYVTLSTALFYNACNLPEEEAEDPCANGEVLFEDEFEGKELDEGKWETNDALLRPREGILEINVNDKLSTVYLQSRSTYTLDDRTLCFEARWKVREREGTGLSIGLYSNQKSGPGFDFDGENLACVTNAGAEIDIINCDAEVTNYTITRFESNRNTTRYSINDRLAATSDTQIPSNQNLFVDISCRSEDNREKKCSLDYVRLLSQ